MAHPWQMVWILAGFILLVAVETVAQPARGHLRGRVLDPAGAPAPGVAMRITHESTGESRPFTPGPDGVYAVASLLPGTYRITSEDDRYRTFAARTHIAIGQHAELELWLGLSSVTMTADVRPTHLPVDHHSAAMTTRPDPQLFEKLPLERRDYLDLAALAPGILQSPVGVASAGSGFAFTGYLVDGLTWFADLRLGAPPMRMPLDAVDELEVRTTPLDASVSRAAGAQINVVTRAGANTPHGSAFGLLQPDGEQALAGGAAGGPLAEDRTFAFGSYQFTTVDGPTDGHLLSGRLDHLLTSSSRLTGRYRLDSTPRNGHTQHAALAFHAAGAGALTNETRVGVSGVDAEVFALAYDATTVQVANATTWTRGRHLVRGGVDWARQSRRTGAADMSGSSVGLFVQDDWWVRPDLSVSAGVRLDHESPETGDDSNRVSPQLGVTWRLDEAAKTLVRGGYGIAYNHLLVSGEPPRLDHWSVSVRRNVSRTRAFEGAYVGSNGSDLLGDTGASRYHAMQLTFEERSDANLAALITYTYGKWTEDFGILDEPVRSPLDSRHRAAAVVVAPLPFGDERRWFTDGLIADILGEMELSGIFRLQSGRPVGTDSARQGPTLRTVDVALLKHVAMGLTRRFQFRLEIYNLTNTDTAPRRRYQLGGRIVF